MAVVKPLHLHENLSQNHHRIKITARQTGSDEEYRTFTQHVAIYLLHAYIILNDAQTM